MKIFEKLFNINQENNDKNPEIDYRLFDLIADWFRHEKLDIGEFENDVFNPTIEIIKSSNEYIKNQFEENSEVVTLKYFNALAVLHLSFNVPDNNFFEKTFQLLFEEDATSFINSVRYIIFDSFDRKAREQNLTLFSRFETGTSMLKMYHAIHLRKHKDVSDYNDVRSILCKYKYNDEHTLFEQLFQYFEKQYLDEKPFIALSVFEHKEWDYREKKIISDCPYQDKIKEALKLSIDEYNQHHELHLNFEIAQKFAPVLGIEHSEKVQNTEYDNRKKLKLKDFDFVQSFIDNAREHEDKHLQNAFYYLGFMSDYYYKSVFTDMLLQITGKERFDKTWMEQLLRMNHKSDHEFFLTAYIAILENIREQLVYNEPLIWAFEQKVFGKQWFYRNNDPHKAGVAFLKQLAERITESESRELYLQRLNEYRLNVKFESNHASLLIDDKDKTHKVLKALVEDMNCILPVALKSVPARSYWSYSDEDSVFFTLNVDNCDSAIMHSDFIGNLNSILLRHKKGYQLLPVPIIAKKDYNGYESYLAALAYMSYHEYQFFLEQYLSVYFPDLINSACYESLQFCDEDCISFLQLKNQQSAKLPASTNGFLSDVNWAWFKEKYIDALSNKEHWYNIMETIIKCSPGKKVNNKWLAEISSKIEPLGNEQYFRELNALISGSIKEESWFLDTYQNALKGFVWTCTHIAPSDASLTIVKTIIEKAYAKVPGVGPKSGALGNFCLDALVSTAKEEAFGILNILRNKTKYNRFANVLEKYIDKFKETSDIPEQLLADRAIPRFGFVGRIKQIKVEDYHLQLSFHSGKLIQKWIDAAGKEYKTTPSEVTNSTALKEAKEEVKQLNTVFTDLSKRIKTFWAFNRCWTGNEWSMYIFGHPLMNEQIQNLIWTNKTRGCDFIVRGEDLVDISHQMIQIDADDEIILWHPVLNTDENIASWQQYIWENKIVQKERQAFREHYPFSATELSQTQTRRFANHFLETNKLMAIANSAGWIFTYVHEGENRPRVFNKTLNITAHLNCDYNRNDYAIPTKELYFNYGNTTNINDWREQRKYEPIVIAELPLVYISEICRDIDLFIATTSISYNPELATRQEMKNYSMDFEKGLFSDNASAKIRRQIIDRLIPVLKINSPGFEGNYLIVKGTLNTYRINLGSGFAQIEGSQKHINIIPSVAHIKKNKKINLPIEDDDILYLILAKALYLQNDNAIEDEKVLALLKGA